MTERQLSPEALAGMLGEAARVLKPGGGLFVYTHVRKNASIAVRAFQMAKEQLDLMSGDGEWKLVVTADKFKDEPGVLAVGNLKDEELVALLRSAKAVVSP
mgnify:CR=1 FL=1